jgi:peptidoglycan/LPS O-acetylase OafA/YrhL
MKTDSLTFTRFIAAMALVIHHFSGNLPGIKGTPVLNLVQKASTLVSFFFVLSGFILVIAYKNRSNNENTVDKRSFYINRFARIYPLYFLALVIYLLLPVTAINPAEPVYPEQIINSFFLTQAWLPKWAMCLNYPGWSLSVEAFFYFLFPFILLWMNKIKFKILISLIAAVWLINIFVYYLMIKGEVNYNFREYHPIVHLSTFLVGMTAGLFYLRYSGFLVKYFKWISLFTVLSIAWMLAAIYWGFHVVEYHHNGMFAPVFVLIILTLASKRTIISDWFSKRPFIFLGEISYGIYILQVPVLLWIRYLNGLYFNQPKGILIGIYLLSLIIFSALSYRFVEQPSRKFIKYLSAWPLNGFKMPVSKKP